MTSSNPSEKRGFFHFWRFDTLKKTAQTATFDHGRGLAVLLFSNHGAARIIIQPMVGDGVVFAIERETRTCAALVFQIEHSEHNSAPMLIEPVEHAGNRKSAGRDIRNSVLIIHAISPNRKERSL